MRLTKKQYLLVVLVFIPMVVAVVVQSRRTYLEDLQNIRSRAALNTQVTAAELQKDFDKGISITESVKSLIINSNGEVHNFQEFAQQLKPDYIGSIQIAPGGVVTDIYPMEGNEAGLMDLMQDEKRGPIVRYGMEHNVVTMQGPFDLKQGGKGIAIRNPVFLEADNGEQIFWGFTIVVIKVPDFFDRTLNSLEAFGYDYCLDTTISPLVTDSVRVASSLEEGHTLTDPEQDSFQIGECTWTICLSPKQGWVSRSTAPVAIGGGVFAVLITLLTYLLLGTMDAQRKFRYQAEQDELTGLYSRRGFVKHMNDAMKPGNTAPMTAVFLVLVYFYEVNDVFVHMFVDAALRYLAGNLKKAFPDALIGRTGGDEFCVLIIGKSAAECARMVQRAVDMEQTFSIGSSVYSYTISAGYADYPAQADDRAHLMTLADHALYAAKLGGKHRCVHYTPEMSAIKRAHMGLSVKDITSGIPGAFLIYKADSSEEILFANDELVHLLGYENFEEFCDHTHANFRNLIPPEELDRVETSIWEQVRKQKLDSGGNRIHYDDYVEYNILMKNAETFPVADFGRMVHSDMYGDLFFVFLRKKDQQGEFILE